MWVAEHSYEVLGTRFSVRSDSEAPACWIADLLAPFAATDTLPVRPRNQFALVAHPGQVASPAAYLDCKRIVRSPSWATVLDRVVGALNRRAIDAMPYFGVHAGVVSTKSDTIIFPAASGAGKSTLVAACLQTGFEYVSDEALCLDYKTQAVIPYPKPLSLSEWSLKVLALSGGPWGRPSSEAKTPLSLDDAQVARTAPDLTAVIFLNRQPGEPCLVARPSSDVMAGLLSMSFNHFKRPADTFQLVSELARNCEGWQLTYNDPKLAAKLLASHFS